MMKTMIPPQVGMRLRTFKKRPKSPPNKKKRPKSPPNKKRERPKKEKGQINKEKGQKKEKGQIKK